MQPDHKHESTVDWSLVTMAVVMTISLVFLYLQLS